MRNVFIGVGLLVISCLLIGCPKCDPWILHCQEQYKQCKERERQKMEPTCKQLYELIQDCQAAGQLVRGDENKCAAFAAEKAKEFMGAGIETGLMVGMLCQQYCSEGKTSKGFPSYSEFEKEHCAISPEKSDCTKCPECP